MRAAWMLCILLAGCATPIDPVVEDPAVDESWQDGQWWHYAITRGDETREITLVADMGAAKRLLASDPEAARTLTADGFGWTGEYDGFTRLGKIISGGGIDPPTIKADIEWLPADRSVGTRWPATQELAGEITAAENGNLTISYRGVFDAGSATYSADVGWFTLFVFPTGEAWNLVAHGLNYTGPLWGVERTADIVDVIGGKLWTHPIGAATEIRFTYNLKCGAPGGAEFRMAESRPIVEPMVQYSDVCPAQATRESWLVVNSPTLGIEANTGQADADEPIVVGTYEIAGLRVEQFA